MMPKTGPNTRIRTHARRFRPVFVVKWTESGYYTQKRFDRLWPSLAFWWKLRYFKFTNLKWEIER
jgi:hypothetical protein